jgi:mono/diheme cytochrome c family protein
MTPIQRNAISPRAAVAVLLLALAAAFLLSTPSAKGQPQGEPPSMPQGTQPMMGPGMMDQDRGQRMGPGMGPWMGRGAGMARHMYYMRNGVPSDYRGKVSPLAATPGIVREGAVLYAENCASCHGARGFGDGEAGRDLEPPPANLAHTIRMPMLSDDYLLWTLSEGGDPVGSEMPAFKDALSVDDMWKIIAAMRAGFLSPTAPDGPADTNR